METTPHNSLIQVKREKSGKADVKTNWFKSREEQGKERSFHPSGRLRGKDGMLERGVGDKPDSRPWDVEVAGSRSPQLQAFQRDGAE